MRPLLERLALGSAFALVACHERTPPREPAPDVVPANSLSDARLHGREESPEREHGNATAADPSRPYTIKVGERTTSDEDHRKKPSAGVVSRAECDRLMDRYLELELGSNPELAGVPREVVDQAKAMARAQHGDAPCTATSAQYACGIAAKTTAAWQRCLE